MKSAESARGEWTVDPATGRSNSSAEFNRLVREIARLIRSEAHHLLAGRTETTAQLILAQLAHEHGLAPTALPDAPESQENT